MEKKLQDAENKMAAVVKGNEDEEQQLSARIIYWKQQKNSLNDRKEREEKVRHKKVLDEGEIKTFVDQFPVQMNPELENFRHLSEEKFNKAVAEGKLPKEILLAEIESISFKDFAVFFHENFGVLKVEEKIALQKAWREGKRKSDDEAKVRSESRERILKALKEEWIESAAPPRNWFAQCSREFILPRRFDKVLADARNSVLGVDAAADGPPPPGAGEAEVVAAQPGKVRSRSVCTELHRIPYVRGLDESSCV